MGGEAPTHEPKKTEAQKQATSQKNAARVKADLEGLRTAHEENPARAPAPAAASTSAASAKSSPHPFMGNKPSFQRPSNPKSALLANGWIEQHRRSKMRGAWKEVLASLVEGRRPGEETTLWIQREVHNSSTGKPDLEALHQIPVKWLESIHYNEYSTDHRFTLKVYNITDEFMFRCKDEESAQNWVITLRSVKDGKRKPATSGRQKPGVDERDRKPSHEEEKKESSPPRDESSGQTTTSKPSDQNPPHRSIKELRAIAHGFGINTLGIMERSELERVVAEAYEKENAAALEKAREQEEVRRKLDEARMRRESEEMERQRVAAAKKAELERQMEEKKKREHLQQKEAEQQRRREELERQRLERERLQREEEEHRRRVAEQERRRQEEIQRQQQELFRQQQEAWKRQQAEEEARQRAAEEQRKREEAQRRVQQQQQQQWSQWQQTQGQQQQYPSNGSRGPSPVPNQYQMPPHPPHHQGYPPQQQNGFPRPPSAPNSGPQYTHSQPPPQGYPQHGHPAGGQPPPPHGNTHASEKYAKMAQDNNETRGSTQHIKHGLLIEWALQPPNYQILRPIEVLISTVHSVFPPKFGCPGHEHFGKWSAVAFNEVCPIPGKPDDEKLTKVVRKLRFFLHPDKLPRDLTDDQQFMCKMLWDITNDAWEDHKKKEEDLGWIRG